MECMWCEEKNCDVVDFNESVDGIGAYRFVCKDCNGSFGMVFDNGEFIEYFD